ncbi:histidine triad nucleotide-binding protein [Thermovenabulum gondwanense]|uniref:HIT-like protein n=1 Tax=Thermovenabulum gondwanense TaxID=520767 RepID=A0A161PVZ0_9FIRM|nr:histidine triad nucleotide-binding protein [Thermovenabulum gondwanense]KYO65164.1 HIT-like protein [Thermovenabulum gondwanense]
MECIFCRIIRKEIPSNIVYEDDNIIAFKDINPQAPVHLLVVPKKHIPNLLEVEEKDSFLILEITRVIKELAKTYNIDDKGFRVVINTGDEGGQTVHHLHFHLLGGRFMTWPPG